MLFHMYFKWLIKYLEVKKIFNTETVMQPYMLKFELISDSVCYERWKMTMLYTPVTENIRKTGFWSLYDEDILTQCILVFILNYVHLPWCHNVLWCRSVGLYNTCLDTQKSTLS